MPRPRAHGGHLSGGRYNRSCILTDVERVQLDLVAHNHKQVRRKEQKVLQRLYRPLTDVCTYLHIGRRTPGF